MRLLSRLTVCPMKMPCASKTKSDNHRRLDQGSITRIDNANPTNQRMIHNTEPKGSDTKGAVLPLNEDRAYPIPKASAPPERRLFLVALPTSSRRLAHAEPVGACCGCLCRRCQPVAAIPRVRPRARARAIAVVLPIAIAAGGFVEFVPA